MKNNILKTSKSGWSAWGIGLLLAVLFMTTGMPNCATAQDFVYQPTNPAFGGSYLNYSWLLNSANVQNQYEEERDFFRRDDPLADFQQRLQRQVLSQLSREIVGERFGEINLDERSTFQFGDFNIEVTPGTDGIIIDIFNTLTGEETSVTIPEMF